MYVRLTWTDCDEAGDCVVPNVLSPRDLASRPDNKDKTVLHTLFSHMQKTGFLMIRLILCLCLYFAVVS